MGDLKQVVETVIERDSWDSTPVKDTVDEIFSFLRIQENESFLHIKTGKVYSSYYDYLEEKRIRG